MQQTDQQIIESTDHWLQQVVIGLNLCPFAKHPYQNQQIHLTISHANSEQSLLTDLATQAEALLAMPPNKRETTVVIIKNYLEDFDDYNQFLDLADDLLASMGWQKALQIASFHPKYQFAGTDTEDAENLTNRSPFPLLHIIRQASIESALKHFTNTPESIFENNIQTVENLSTTQKQTLFPYIFPKNN